VDVIAAYNPLSYIADGLRHPIAFSNDVVSLLEGLGAAAAVTAVALGLSMQALRGRLREA
jgi:ABC-2 type transport system permease protein